MGVAGQVCRRTLTDTKSAAFGAAFKHFLLQEILAARSYQEADWPIAYWRTKSGFETDFALNQDEIAV